MVDDAKKLGSGTPIENMYGNYINALGKLQQKGRDLVDKTPNMHISKEAKIKYRPQLESLDKKLSDALMNAPKERQAQLIANRTIASKRTPDMQPDQLKKLKQQSIAAARIQVGASGKKVRISIDDDEWAAIQSGAVSTNKLTQIIRYSDSDRLKQLATPRKSESISLAKASRAKAMLRNGHSYAEVSEALGLSVSSIQNIVE